MNIRRVVFALLGGAACLAHSVQSSAADLRSWDKQINNVGDRFVVLTEFGSQAVLDRETQLVWQLDGTAEAKFWHAAMDNCSKAVIGGRSGWRLPSGAELSSLFGTGGRLPDGHPFKIAANQLYWTTSASPYQQSEYFSQAAKLDVQQMSYGNRYGVKYRALCVRGIAGTAQ